MANTTNADLVQVALKIAAADTKRQKLLAQDKMPSYWDTGTAVDNLVSSLDNEISWVCDELRSACLASSKVETSDTKPGERIVPLAAAPEWRPMECGSE